jgi:hypothetical protein
MQQYILTSHFTDNNYFITSKSTYRTNNILNQEKLLYDGKHIGLTYSLSIVNCETNLYIHFKAMTTYLTYNMFLPTA